VFEDGGQKAEDGSGTLAIGEPEEKYAHRQGIITKSRDFGEDSGSGKRSRQGGRHC